MSGYTAGMGEPAPKSTLIGRIREALVLTSARASAERELPTLDAERQRALGLARDALIGLELLRFPHRAFPFGSGPTLALTMATHAAHWALAAQPETVDATSLRSALDSLGEATLASTLGAESLAALRRAATATAHPADLPALTRAVHALEARANARARALDRLKTTSTVRTSLAVIAAVALVWGLFTGGRAALRAPDLARNQPWRTSSNSLTCFPKEHNCGGTTTDILFHTTDQESPWYEVDLGAPRTIRELEVKNRRDCCQDRLLPLVLEVSDDQQSWREIARRTETFLEWTVEVTPVTARYVRARVPKKTILHFEGLSVR